MSSQLFRPEVSEQPTINWLGAVRLATPLSHRIWAGIAVLVGLAVVVWLSLGSYTRREHVSGMIVPASGLIELSSTATGTVSRLFVAEGERVQANQPLMVISSEHVSETLGSAESGVSRLLQLQQSQLLSDISDTQKVSTQQADDLRRQLSKLSDQLAKLNKQLAIEQKQIDFQQEVLDKMTPLLSRGYVALIEVQQQKSSLLSAQGQYQSLLQQRDGLEQQGVALRDQLEQLPSNAAVKIGDLRRQAEQVAQTLAQNEVGRASVIRAPRDGLVSSLLVRNGQFVNTAQTVISVEPSGTTMQAQLMVPSRAIGFVHEGAEVLLRYQAYPYQKFGLQHGVVRKVSDSALSPSQVTALLGGQAQSSEPLYRVLVELPSQNVMAYGHPERLRPGMAVEGDLLLDRRRISEWVFEPLLAAGRQWEAR